MAGVVIALKTGGYPAGSECRTASGAKTRRENESGWLFEN
jgi:hypothetical protein